MCFAVDMSRKAFSKICGVACVWRAGFIFADMINYKLFEGRLGLAAQRSFFQMYGAIFGTTPDEEVMERLSNKEDILLQLAVNESDTPIGFKIGYRENAGIFYSWLGGVLPEYRQRGISSQLMQAQHEWCAQHGYRIVRTKTCNQWRNMLLLNIRSGFDIVDTYKGPDGIIRIVLEKQLI